VVHYDNLSIYRADAAKQVLLPVLTREEHAEEVARYIIPFGRGLMGWVVEHGEAVLANDALADPRALQIPGTPADQEALIVVPLISDGQVTGSMNVSRVGGEDIYFSETDFELVQLFAAQAAVALRNADEHHAMSLRAETDALTGLSNHGAFQRDLAEAIETVAAAPSEAGQLGLLMMDLDRFKTYNDHSVTRPGTPCTRSARRYSATRAAGVLYGGDELRSSFRASIPPLSEWPSARRPYRRCREHGAAPVTITAAPPCSRTAGIRRALIASADAVMYAGKQAGGDRVRVPGEAAPAPRRKAAKPRDPDGAMVQRRRRSDARSPKTTAA
jgi:GGDEF domain-containing protein